jgi:hypothetical protein
MRVQTSTIDLPALCLRAALGSVNEELRTVDLTFSTGAGVIRFDWDTGTRYLEKLSLDPKHVRMDRLNSGAPLLDTHSAWSLANQIGVVEDGSASVDGKRGRATVRFSKRADVEPFYQDVRDRIIRNVSNGYVVYRYEETPAKGNSLPVRLAVDWEPYEISMVPMPADYKAQTRAGDKSGTTPCVIVPCGYEQAIADADLNLRLRLAAAATF